jgi:hypothetical protein
VAIVYAYIRRIGRPDLVLPMWQGMATVWNNGYDLTAYRWLTVGTETGRFLGPCSAGTRGPRSSRSSATCCTWSP